MKSPFPGMDPYIEECGLWEDFHHDLISEIKRALANDSPERYVVRAGERSYIVVVESEGKIERPFIPDVSVTESTRGKKSSRKKNGTVTVAELDTEDQPIDLRAFIAEEHREAFVEILEATADQRLVTCVEVLSPSNKRPGTAGWDQYQAKRQSLMLGGIHLVEIDLLRGGQRPPMLDPWPRSPYTLTVARASVFQRCRVWPAHFQRPLPPIPVPLAHPDPDLTLNLQPMIEAIYQRSRYARSIDYGKPLAPPLASKETAWLKQQLKARGNKP